MLPVEFAAVNHPAPFGLPTYLIRCPPSGSVIIQVSEDGLMRTNGRHRFGEVGHGIQYDSVGSGTPFPAHRHIGEVIHESFEYGYRIATAGECGDGLG